MASEDLPLAQSPYVSVFRAVDQILRADPDLRRVGTTIKSWQGDSSDDDPPASGDLPFLRLTPSPGPVDWWSPDSQTGDLVIDLEIVTSGWNVDNAANMWWAVARALQPTDQTANQAVAQTLRDAGSYTGIVTLNMPAYAPTKADSGSMMVSARGQIRVEEVRLSV